MGTRRVQRLNKTRRKYGGEKIGEGKCGIAYDVYSEESECLYALAKKNKTNSIELFFINQKSKILDDPDEIEKFEESLKNAKDTVAKIIKPVSFFSFISTTTKFLEEVKTNQETIDEYGPKNAKKYLVLSGVDFENNNVVAAIFYGNANIHCIFNAKCVSNYDMNIKEFTIDLLESLTHLTKNHNDIKLDNIVKCSDRYKLIDWDNSGPRNKIIRGTITTCSPIKLYLYYGVSKIVKALFANSRLRRKEIRGFGENNPESTSEYQEQYRRIISEYDHVISLLNKTQLFEKYKETFDVFAVGMCVLFASIHYREDYTKYRDVIAGLTSLKEPLNAKQALAFAKKFFKNQQV